MTTFWIQRQSRIPGRPAQPTERGRRRAQTPGRPAQNPDGTGAIGASETQMRLDTNLRDDVCPTKAPTIPPDRRVASTTPEEILRVRASLERDCCSRGAQECALPAEPGVI